MVRAISTVFCSPPDSDAGQLVAAPGNDREALGDLGGPSRDRALIGVDVSAHEDVVPDRHRREQAALLRHVGEAAGEQGPWRPAGDVIARLG